MPAKVKEIRRNKLMREVRELWTKHQNASESDKAALRIKYEAMLDEVADIDERKLHDELENTGQAVNDDPQFQELTQRGSIGEIVSAVLDNRETTGETRELQTELNLTANQIPLSMLTEQRAATVAPANVARNQGEILGSVFPQSMAAWLNVPMPTIPAGSRSYPVLTTGATAAAPNKAGVVSESDGVFAATDMKPKRIQASFLFAREDAATMPGMDEALRQELSDALVSKLDAQIITAIIAGGTASDQTSKVADYGIFTDLLHVSVDGAYAPDPMDIRCLFGSDTYKLAASAFSNSTTKLAPTAAQRLRDESGGLRVSSNVPATASKKQKGILRLGNRMDAVCPLWQGVEIISDNLTQSQKGQIIVTAIMLHNVSVLRKGAFVIPEFQTVA